MPFPEGKIAMASALFLPRYAELWDEPLRGLSDGAGAGPRQLEKAMLLLAKGF